MVYMGDNGWITKLRVAGNYNILFLHDSWWFTATITGTGKFLNDDQNTQITAKKATK